MILNITVENTTHELKYMAYSVNTHYTYGTVRFMDEFTCSLEELKQLHTEITNIQQEIGTFLQSIEVTK